MADSWIRMRGSLVTNPKVLAMARVLLADPDFLDWYGNESVTLGSSRAVTLRHVTVVTRVTVGALTPLWSMVNECAAIDGIVRGATLFEVDGMAGVPGFGKAMVSVGWLEVLADGVHFPNFCEHNTVTESRSTAAKTPAQRSKEYRERQKENVTEYERDGVTEKRDASRDAVTTEKRREEKSNNPSSLRSEGDAAVAPTPAPAKPERKKRQDTTLADFLSNCREQGVKPVPEDHAIRRWAAEAGMSDEMLQIAWLAFRERYTDDANYAGKRYKDWAAHFANSVKDNWFSLWFASGADGVQWSSKGLMRKQALDAARASKEQQQREQEGSHAPG